jgi:alkylation response protein AidB-like acyl-CoA dehydrogenase
VDFAFSEEQEQIRNSARDFLQKECPMTFVRGMMDDERGHSDGLWRKMADLGWMGLIFPEAYGGAGLTYVDLVAILEEMGRVVMPGPFFATVVLGGVTILEGASEEQRRILLPAIAAGEQKTTLALLEASARWDAAGVECEARRDGDGYRLRGTKLFVNDALVADKMVCAARLAGSSATEGDSGAGITLFVIDAGTPGLVVTPLKTMDRTRKLAEVALNDVRVGEEAVIGAVGDAWPIIERVMDRGRVALCAEMCGGAQKVLEMSVEYAKVREQFGRPIGSFQAIQHKCANMLVEVESARSATYYAAWAAANDVPDAPLAAAMAKAYCSDAYRRTTGEGIQVHGGIGFTWEHDMHLYFKRAKGSEVTFGDATWNRELVARLIDL